MICSTDLKRFAVLYASSEVDEVHWRASVSRAYYAAFHALLPIALSLPKCDPRDSHDYLSHGEVLGRLKEWKPSEPNLIRLKGLVGTLAVTTKAARAARVRADYRLDSPFEISDAKMQIARVQKILVAAQQIEKEMISSHAAKASAGLNVTSECLEP